MPEGTLELAARLNREIGLGSEDRPPGITITFVSNLKPGSLKHRYQGETTPNPPAPLKTQTPSAHDRLKRQVKGK
jgi:hypothetical protein